MIFYLIEIFIVVSAYYSAIKYLITPDFRFKPDKEVKSPTYIARNILREHIE